MKILDVNGNITMYDSDGFPHIVASLKHGATYGANNQKDMGTVMITIYPGHNNLQDNFIFYDKNQIPFSFIQSRSLNPNLKKLYAGFIVNESDQSWDNFLSMVMSDYFIKLLGYTHPNYTQEKPELLD